MMSLFVSLGFQAKHQNKALIHLIIFIFSNAAMTFFNPNAPLLCKKQNVLELPDMPGLWRCHWQVGNLTIFSTFYTRLDQACILWGVISILIFVTAQFFPISWMTQAVWWSLLSLVGTLGMVVLTPSWLRVEGLGWVLYSWVILMLLGLVVTDLGIFLGWGEVLNNLCPLWLGLIALGCNTDDKDSMQAILDDNAQVEKVADGFEFTEGPLWHPKASYSLVIFPPIPSINGHPMKNQGYFAALLEMPMATH
jgi:hypothetical protein